MDLSTMEENSTTLAKFSPVDRRPCSSSPCIVASGASNVMSKKVKARKVIVEEAPRQNALWVYQRRAKRPRLCRNRPSFFEALSWRIDPGARTPWIIDVDEIDDPRPVKKRKELKNLELLSLRGANGFGFGGAGARERIRKCNYKQFIDGRTISGKRSITDGISSCAGQIKRWMELTTEDADPCCLVGLSCKVFWPMDDVWYRGSISGFNAESGLHKILYKDGDVENLNLRKERIRFYVSRSEIRLLKLKGISEKDTTVNDEMLAMAAVLNDCQDLEPGDLVWAKLTGHAMWPGVVIDEAYAGASVVLKTMQGDRAVSVQFFGTHDFARIKIKHVVPFLQGAASGYHLKCKKKRFYQSLEEAKMYLCKQQLPTEMLQQQKVGDAGANNVAESESEHDSLADEENERKIKLLFPLKIGDLRVLSLGSIVRDSKYFHNRRYIWPEGYTAERKFFSTRDPGTSFVYKMEVLRNPKAKSRPLFRVALEDGFQVEGSNPDACWREIFNKIRRKLFKYRNIEIGERQFLRTGSQMFGFSNRKVYDLIQALVTGGSHKNFNKLTDLPAGYRPVTWGQRDLDRCDVCHMDEEYEDNLFLQCDKCRMMVHAKCYGELELKDGALWHCHLCRPEAPKITPICCLCPVTGGAMKPTTDGRWAHLACAIWIPETCLLDVKKMEPIDGLSSINKDRWKLLCSICGVQYGACIQCSSTSCRVAYHPLCARSSGLCIEPEDVDQVHLASSEDDDSQCISLLSFCKRHRQQPKESQPSEECHVICAQPCSTYVPPANPSGSARCGKSRIHGYGVFAKLGHKAGDMVIEYTGETVRPPIADQREHLIYNSLVGAGTYMFRIDDERVIDATKAGSIAQLINHSCEPNCYSRVISVDGDEHIIIFAKRDLEEWEELTYDYRFFSIDEQLACYCGFPKCRGIVNDVDSEGRVAKLWVPQSELIPWNGE
ncbi:histone-lysine N-methyltransferase TRX1-like isoform X2 [Wolffia australiana]